jgi:hypothetical protein
MSSPAGSNRERAVGWGEEDGLTEDFLVLEVGGLALSQQTADGVLQYVLRPGVVLEMVLNQAPRRSVHAHVSPSVP